MRYVTKCTTYLEIDHHWYARVVADLKVVNAYRVYRIVRSVQDLGTQWESARRWCAVVPSLCCFSWW